MNAVFVFSLNEIFILSKLLEFVVTTKRLVISTLQNTNFECHASIGMSVNMSVSMSEANVLPFLVNCMKKLFGLN